MFYITEKEFIKIFFRFCKDNHCFLFILNRIISPEHYLQKLRQGEYSSEYSGRSFQSGIKEFISRINKTGNGMFGIFSRRNVLPFEYEEFEDGNFRDINDRWVGCLKENGISCDTKIAI